MKKKQKSSRATRVPRVQRATETATIDRVRRKAEADRRRHGTKSIEHTDGDDYVFSERYGFRVRRAFLPDGRPAASNVGGDAKAQGKKFLALVKSMSIAYPTQVAAPILDPGLSRLTPRVVAAIKNLENASQILCAQDPDFRAVRMMFTNMRTGKSNKSVQASVTAAVVDAVNAASGTKSASGAVSIRSTKEDDPNVIADCVEAGEVAAIIAHGARLGAELGENLNTDAGREALSNYISEAIALLANGGDTDEAA